LRLCAFAGKYFSSLRLKRTQLEEMLAIRELKKTYPGGVQALKGITIEIPAGMFGLLGPNGAGKTTLMKIAATLLEPDSGEVKLDGVDLIADKKAARRMLGYLPQEFGLYPSLTAEQTLDYLAKLKGVMDDRERKSLLDALFERVNLEQARKQKVGGFSGGMRQRLGIAQALIGGPHLIIVDEPTAGLDPEERVRFHNLLSEIAGEKTIVILSTHIVADVSNLCSRMAIMREGSIIASSTPQDALTHLAGSIWEAALSQEQVAALKKTQLRIISTQVFDGKVRVRVFAQGMKPGEEFNTATPTLEDYYFTLASRQERVN
jgi:ABC-2 type transport system ATP-binding protein